MRCLAKLREIDLFVMQIQNIAEASRQIAVSKVTIVGGGVRRERDQFWRLTDPAAVLTWFKAQIQRARRFLLVT